MYKNKSVCVVIPAYNEETQIGMVIETMPDYVDKMIIIDDCSRDRTVEVVKGYQRGNPKIVLIAHEANQGGGGLQVGQRQ
jgi:glycosyltransferase involved in cell wall biosynthesis